MRATINQLATPDELRGRLPEVNRKQLNKRRKEINKRINDLSEQAQALLKELRASSTSTSYLRTRCFNQIFSAMKPVTMSLLSHSSEYERNVSRKQPMLPKIW